MSNIVRFDNYNSSLMKLVVRNKINLDLKNEVDVLLSYKTEITILVVVCRYRQNVYLRPRGANRSVSYRLGQSRWKRDGEHII